MLLFYKLMWLLCLILFVTFVVVGISNKLEPFEFPSAKEGSLTPDDGIGEILLPRKELIEQAYESVCADIAERSENIEAHFNTSHYWRSVKGSGKSVFLNLLGRKFQQNGYEVFHMRNTGKFDYSWVDFLNSIVKSRPVGALPLVLLLDEAPHGVALPIWNDLFRHIKPMAVLAVGITDVKGIDFYERHEAVDMFIKPGNALDEVVDALCEHYGDSSPKHDDVKKLCEYVCKWTGGNIFPLLKLCVYAMSFPNWENSFIQRLTSESLSKTSVYRDINRRCCSVHDLPKSEQFKCFLAASPTTDDVAWFSKLGWWDEYTCRWFMSAYVMTLMFNEVPAVSHSKDIVEFPPDASAAELIDLLIRTGLEKMTPNDFVDDKFDYSIGYLWAFYLRSRMPQLYLCLAPQVRTVNSNVRTLDFVFNTCNGNTDVVIDLMFNGAEADVNEHWARLDDEYKPWKGRSAMLNIQLTGRDMVAFPGANVYTFFTNSNKLYHGHKLVKTFKGAQIKIPPHSSGMDDNKKHYSTWSRPMPPAKRLLRYLR
jgi:hypothetical protein